MKQHRVVGIVAGVALVVTGTAVAVAKWPSGEPVAAVSAASPPEDTPVAPVVDDGDGTPVPGELHTVAVGKGASTGAAEVPKRETPSFSMVGVTWTDHSVKVSGDIEVRTRSVQTGAWSGWQALGAGEDGPDSGAEASGGLRGATEPLWVGPSDGVAARITAGKGSKPLPAGLRVDLIDPGKPKGASGGQGGGLLMEPSEEPSAPVTEEPSATPPTTEPVTTPPTTAPTTTPPAATTAPTTTPATTKPTTTAPATTKPTTSAPPVVIPPSGRVSLPNYTSRAGWGADETIVKGTPSYASAVNVFFVHHTADGGNTYSCADSAARVRAILTYHVKSNGWSDIGYNFLVDRCGKLFEGRKGGVDKAVIGAHTYGFNTGTAAIAVMGTYTSSQVSEAARKVVSQVAAARLTQYGFDPASTAKLTEGVSDGKFPKGTVVTFQRVSGHRDAVNTACPGNALYAQLGTIRNEASMSVLALKVTAGGGTWNGTKLYVKSSATAYWSTATPSAQITKFEVLVDGVSRGTTGATVRSAKVNIPAGTHKVAVRATHRSGRTTTSAAATVYTDTTKPSVSTPSVLLRKGTATTSKVPVSVNFTAKDNVKLFWVGATSPAKANLSTSAKTWSTTVKPGKQTFTVGARDLVGNNRSASVVRTAVLIPETKAKRNGTWTTKVANGNLDGKALTSSKKNAKLRWTYTGRSFGIVAMTGKKAGKFDVLVDGKKVSTVDTKASKNGYRQVVWTRNLASGKHTIQLVVLGTSGRPAVTVDGLAYVK
ncbi:N-acetylmuramoyl-L-alanine amidase [Actinoplanes sp. NPDC051494]|uniref:N-acetylmuramoyl-L-alanine amidase n=1 Tax=Actinoplanes sp. NPDC051494 TaxID=3363907 RepID=UPI00379FF36C